ncbi:MAG: mitochondrial Homoaconitase [Geoglossum umbratile]|nr:MAG: mitochondrial Homoaconitase [Geoglossum umbratile]
MFTGTLPEGTTGKDVIAALCGFFKNDEVLNHAIEFTGSEETMRSLPIDARLTIANQSTEWGGLSGLFPIDSMLKAWLRAKATEYALYDSNTAKRFNHQRLDELFKNPLEADKGAKYAKYLTLNLSTLCPYVSGPNSVKVATPLAELESQNIKVDRAYVISCTNSRRSDLAAAARVFKEAAKKNNNIIPKIPDHVNFYIAAASLPEQKAAEEQGDWQALLDAGAQDLPAACGACIGLGVGLLEPGEIGISASNRNFKARMGSREAQAYLASPEVVAASALAGKISGPGWYKKPADWVGVEKSEGEPFAKKSVDEALEAIIGRLDSIIHASSAPSLAESGAGEGNEDTLTKLYPGFPEKIKGEIVFCDADNLNTDGIYPGKYTYQDDVPAKKMAEVCMENFDPAFRELAKPGDILVSGFNFGCGSSREQAATAILAKGIPLVIAGSFGNIFSRNSINNALMGVEVPKLIHRLREVFTTSSSQDGKESGEKVLTRRTGWTLEWDVRRSKVTITESDGKSWSQKVAELPPNVQEVIASGGLEKWVKAQIGT